MAIKYVIGIDEVGRGPLAGPVAVGMVVMEMEKYEALKLQAIFKAGKDSKKLTAKGRDKSLVEINKLKEVGELSYGVFYESNEIIDKIGIVKAIWMAIMKGLRGVTYDPAEVLILMDGGLKAPKRFINQQAIIDGDEKELIISLASIAAKVSRDNKMMKLAVLYPGYGFADNKGYGTKEHIEALRRLGPISIHRKSFIAGLLERMAGEKVK